ncbi:hypothetical protein ACNAN0_10725 [Agrilactobacillus fermenti]|uniref:hypothetical protein n=1 Tax=Agrilactobacillus fermenti TaxID=2586909 RepID=UPI003A5BE565
MGEKVRITMNDGNVYVGFWDAPFENHSAKTAELVRYDLDENNSKLRSFNNVSIFIPIQNIVKIEAILHSNPRWGTRPTNKFVFAELVKINLESSAPFRNWPIK